MTRHEFIWCPICRRPAKRVDIITLHIELFNVELIIEIPSNSILILFHDALNVV